MENKKILVIDDEHALAQLIKLELESRGYTAEMVFSGAAAIEKLKTYKPDLITLDVMMPDMTGFQVLELLTANEEYKKIPVIFVTVIASEIQKKRAKEMGAYDMIPKPIDFDKLVGLIEKMEDSFIRLHL